MDNWKPILKRMKLESIKQKGPGFFELSGGYEMKIIPYKDTTANALTRCIIDWITFKGGYANRVSSQGQVRKINGRMIWTHGSANKGTSDVHAIIRGRHVSIEVKIGRDRMSDNQIKEMDRVNRAGGLYFVARDMQSFVEWYNQTF